MSFLTPWFLLGALAVAAPLIFHLIRRTTRNRTSFGAMMFLKPTPPRLTKRSRFEHLLLLCLRCVALCLLAFAFARPFFDRDTSQSPLPAAKVRQLMLLVDISASMQRGNLWGQTVERVNSLLKEVTPRDQVAVFAFDRRLRPLLTFEQWISTPADQRMGLIQQRLSAIKPGYSGTDVGKVFIEAVELLAESVTGARADHLELIVLSDLQEGGRAEGLQGIKWPRGLQVRFETLKPVRNSNASFHLLAESEESLTNAVAGIRVLVANAGDSKREEFKIRWGGVPDRGVNLALSAGQSRIIVVPTLPEGVVADRLILEGDEEPFDNTVYVVPPVKTDLRVAYLGDQLADGPADPLFFLRRALQDTAREEVELVTRPSSGWTPESLKTANLLIVAAGVEASDIAAARPLVEAGKTLLYVPSAGGIDIGAPALIGHNVALHPIKPQNYAMLSEIDFKHPIFAAFADPRFSDFSRIHFWRYLKLDASSIPQARKVASFDNGDPAILEVPVGKGRVVLFTFGWTPQESQLALSSKFVPLMHSLLEFAYPSDTVPVSLKIDDLLPTSGLFPEDGQSRFVINPAGVRNEVPAGAQGFSETAVPGVYTLESGALRKRVAVNIDPFESRTRPLTIEEFEALGVPVFAEPTALQKPGADRQRVLQRGELEAEQKLWRWLLLAGMVVLLIETIIAGRTFGKEAIRGGAA